MQTKYHIIALVMTMAAVLFASGCSSRIALDSPELSIGTPAWYAEIDNKLSVSEQSGFAVGSTQWLWVVNSLADVDDHLGHGPDLDSPEWQRCVNKKLFGVPISPDIPAEEKMEE